MMLQNMLNILIIHTHIYIYIYICTHTHTLYIALPQVAELWQNRSGMSVSVSRKQQFGRARTRTCKRAHKAEFGQLQHARERAKPRQLSSNPNKTSQSMEDSHISYRTILYCTILLLYCYYTVTILLLCHKYTTL